MSFARIETADGIIWLNPAHVEAVVSNSESTMVFMASGKEQSFFDGATLGAEIVETLNACGILEVSE